MIIKDKTIYNKAYELLKSVYGPDATFHEGQYEAIEATLTNKRTIVVQKTGWGKSLVYFIASRMVKGMTIVISPLLVLMDNQKEAAEKMNLKCALLDSRADKDEILKQIETGNCDVLFTTPETLYNPQVQAVLPNMNIGLFVVDECHCISDWGHDFRLNYGKINRILESLPQNVPVLGTTATANDRVVEDLKRQFGKDVYVSRGPLTRESLHIEILKLDSRAKRYAWLAENVNKLPGVGIVYCLTQRDCDRLSAFLCGRGINARAYHSGSELKDEIPEIEEKFRNNRIKVLVATIKMGMGYDKDDIGFVIHYQMPSSIVSYYQQIGRAGRKEGAEAYCYLMTGKEDRDIHEYFIKNAFPSKEQEESVISALENAENGLTKNGLSHESNISIEALERSIKFLMNQNIIYQDWETKKYFRSVNPYHFMGDYYQEIKKIKISEYEAMEALNDRQATDCGKCFNCLHHEIIPGVVMPTDDYILEIQDYLGNLYYTITPRKRWGEVNNPFDRTSIIENTNEEGLALSKSNDAGYGEMVAYDKYRADAFRKELVDKSVSLLKEKIGDEGYTIVTNIPSARNHKVADFARQVADGLGYEYKELLTVTGIGEQQKNMQNTFYQYKNALEKIKLADDQVFPEGAGIILIDDLVDSKWTLTVAGGLLKSRNAGKVFPFCLADSSRSIG